MAKQILKFNNIEYRIDESKFADPKADLEQYLSNVINGSGAEIVLDGQKYDVDAIKLSDAMNSFTVYLESIQGEGAKVIVNGIEYSVDSTKLSGAVSELETVLSGMSEGASSTERLEGDGAEFHTMAPTALSFRSSAPLDELVDVKINGEIVDASNYILEEGSTIVTFPIDYLQGLLQGKHEVTVESQNGAASGDFTVVRPELNEYGFYYNQPYVGYIAAYNGNFAFFVQEGGTLSLISLDQETEAIPCTYTIEGNNTAVTSPMGVFTGVITEEGFYVNEFATTFVLGDELAVADDNYIYRYNSEAGGYSLSSFNIYAASLPKARDNVNDYKTVRIANSCFRDHNLISIPELPDNIQTIGAYAFCACSELTAIRIPNGVKTIEEYAFESCTSVKKIVIPTSVTYIGDLALGTGGPVEEIIYEGTVAQWNNIIFDGSGAFHRGISGHTTYVQCSDGQVSLILEK